MVLQKVGEFVTDILVNGTQQYSKNQSSDTTYDLSVSPDDIIYNITWEPPFPSSEEPYTLAGFGFSPESGDIETDGFDQEFSWDLTITNTGADWVLFEGSDSFTVSENEVSNGYNWTGSNQLIEGLFMIPGSGSPDDNLSIEGQITLHNSGITVDNVEEL
jgi:hypothetical protein